MFNSRKMTICTMMMKRRKMYKSYMIIYISESEYSAQLTFNKFNIQLLVHKIVV